jgi:hypothetical protein
VIGQAVGATVQFLLLFHTFCWQEYKQHALSRRGCTCISVIYKEGVLFSPTSQYNIVHSEVNCATNSHTAAVAQLFFHITISYCLVG